MNEYVLIFRLDIFSKDAQPTPEQMEIYMSDWMKWINWISANNKLVDGGNHLQYSGRLIKPNNIIIDKPYSANKESVAGYIIILADNIEGAVEIAKRCPILKGKGNSVEVRQTATPESMKSAQKTQM
jgi:hypothetical protein